VLDHLPASRLALERLGDILAQLADRAAALGAGARRRIDDALARQVLRQWAAGRLASTSRARRRLHYRGGDLGCRLLFRHTLLELGELQLELLDQLGATLGGLAEPLAAHPGEQQLEPLNLERGGRYQGLGPLPRVALDQDHGVRRSEIGGQWLVAG
jgi:hypothetical protein